jgi:hypothetical protein
MEDRYVFGPKHVVREAWRGDYFGPQTIADYIVTTVGSVGDVEDRDSLRAPHTSRTYTGSWPRRLNP